MRHEPQGLGTDKYGVRCVQDVWAAITADPTLSQREYAEITGHGVSTVHGCIKWLINAGYIKPKQRYIKGIKWTVIVPCI